MPNESCLSIEFAEDTTISFPADSSMRFPQIPAFQFSHGFEIPVSEGTSIVFPSDHPLMVNLPDHPPIQLDPVGGTVAVPGREPVALGDLFEMGLGLSFPSETTISLPGRDMPSVKLKKRTVVRIIHRKRLG